MPVPHSTTSSSTSYKSKRPRKIIPHSKQQKKWMVRGVVGIWILTLVGLLRTAFVMNFKVLGDTKAPQQHAPTRIRIPPSSSSNQQQQHKYEPKKNRIISKTTTIKTTTRTTTTTNHTLAVVEADRGGGGGGGSSDSEKEEQPIATIAHAVSFLNCGYTLTEKYKDALLVLRHSIHQQSWHATTTTTAGGRRTSQYSYQMYAFINNDPDAKCAHYADWIRRMGYIPLLLPNPVTLSHINNTWFRTQIDKTGVAGSSELIKLYLYTLTQHPIVCHWDLDVIIKKPMDDLFNAMLFDKDSQEGQLARSKLQLQQPLHQRLPDVIDAYITRDVALAKPWIHRQVAQGGFLVARTNVSVLEHYVRIVEEANFSTACGNEGGWGNLGYGCQMGAMHFQGVVAYYYDQIHPGPGKAVELDVCAWNQIGHSVTYDTGKYTEYLGSCRQSPIYGGLEADNRPEFGACHDCRVFDLEQTNTIHYTACSKPWQCKWKPPPPNHDNNSGNTTTTSTATTNATTCGLLIREFYNLRKDLENQLHAKTGQIASSTKRFTAAYEPDVFLGYCGHTKKKGVQYAGMTGIPESFDMKELYGF